MSAKRKVNLEASFNQLPALPTPRPHTPVAEPDAARWLSGAAPPPAAPPPAESPRPTEATPAPEPTPVGAVAAPTEPPAPSTPGAPPTPAERPPAEPEGHGRPEAPSSPRGRAKPKAKASALRRDESGERTVVYLPPDLATELRVFCARSRRSLSDAAAEGVTLLLKAHRHKAPKEQGTE
jgi:hypothetical protein